MRPRRSSISRPPVSANLALILVELTREKASRRLQWPSKRGGAANLYCTAACAGHAFHVRLNPPFSVVYLRHGAVRRNEDVDLFPPTPRASDTPLDLAEGHVALHVACRCDER